MSNIHYGKPRNYPYYFVATHKKNKSNKFVSGTFHKKEDAKKMAKEYSKNNYNYKVIDRRSKK